MRIRTSDFPKLNIGRRPYAAIRRYFDSVKPWRSKYNPDDERPIGQRACKLTSDGLNWGSGIRLTSVERAEDREGARFNKAMRMLADGSIAFRLYDTDCVIYHPDNRITVHGYASVSTNDFINALTPMGVSHMCRGKGRDSYFEPTLHLRPVIEHVDPPNQWCDEERRWTGPDWHNGVVVNCDGPVTIYYSVEKRQFYPVHADRLEPFCVHHIDRRKAREVSRRYNLAKLEKIAVAAAALLPSDGYVSQRTDGGAPMRDIMDALIDGDFATAINLMPRGGGSTAFGREEASRNSIRPGFLRWLRDFIYKYEGVVGRVREPILTPQQYERYKTDDTRYG